MPRKAENPFFQGILGKKEQQITGESYTLPANTTYEQWKAMQDEKYGAGTIDKRRKMVYNESADKVLYEKYKVRLGNDAPKSFAEFQTLKYDKQEDYNDLRSLYRYKETVPEATRADYKTCIAIEEIGIRGIIRVPALKPPIDISSLFIDSSHISKREHNVSLEEAISFIHNARFSVYRTIGKGDKAKEFINYYSDDGATYVDFNQKIIRTAFKKEEFDEKTKMAMEAVKNGR